MKKHNWRKKLFGVQKKVYLYIVILVAVTLMAITICIQYVMKTNMYEAITKQYTYASEKLFLAFEKQYEEIDKVTEACIINEYVQKSLYNEPLDTKNTDLLMRGLTYLSNRHMDYYLFIDNKGNAYSQKNINLNLERFYQSKLYKNLGNDYSKTKLLWERDVLFGTFDMSLFAGRFVHQMDRAYKPGIIYLKLDANYLKNIFDEVTNSEAQYLLLDENSQVCYEKIAPHYKWQEDEKKELFLEIEKLNKMDSKEMPRLECFKGGIICMQKDANTGFTIATYVPKAIFDKAFREVRGVIILIFIVILFLALLLSGFIARKITKPIKLINDYMTTFDESKLYHYLFLDTNTELDTIGISYNAMIRRVKNLMEEVQLKERELRSMEINSLTYQMHPHFLYNTLDTIYMLARISKEETIMQMIQALSKFLRINLSKGEEMIPIEKELEHVSAYLDIQKIRNGDLFEYEVKCEESLKNIKIIKLILQPLVENSIKHGFSHIDEGGKIKICVEKEKEYLVFSVENNGKPITDERLKIVNELEKADLETINNLLPGEKGGYGICNIVKRLRLKYNEQIRFYYTSEPEGTMCFIKIKWSSIQK